MTLTDIAARRSVSPRRLVSPVPSFEQIATLDDIVARRSVSPRRLTESGPNPEQVRAMIEAACAVPDHRRLRPWRIALIRNDERTKLADLLEAAARETE